MGLKMVLNWQIILCIVVAIVITGKYFRGSSYTIIFGFLGMVALNYVVLTSVLARI